MDSPDSRGLQGIGASRGQWDLQDSRAQLVYLVYQGSEELLVREAGLCLDTKEKREIRAPRGLQGPSRSWSHQKTSTLKERRVLRVQRGSVEIRVYRVWRVFQGTKERWGL